MFQNLQERLQKLLVNLRGQGRLTEENIRDALREVRLALLEADVALPVVREFIAGIQTKALGAEVNKSLTPGQVLIKIVHDELVNLMGEFNEKLNLATAPPAVVLLAGLQGSGKTTTVAKLARWIQEKQKKSVLVVSCDVYRPAAIEQLRTVAAEVGAEFCPSQSDETPVIIAQRALEQARKKFKDVLLIDTAGRLHIDAAMMEEIKILHAALHPIETLLVVDAMTGQDAVNTAKAFNITLPLTGVILTKTDGDARGGAALSLRQITGKPIKFLGIGEKNHDLEPFHPDRVASRILGMGDVVSFVEEMQDRFDQEQTTKLLKKLQKGKDFDLTDFKDQLEQMGKLGGVRTLLDKIPGMQQLPEYVKNQLEEKKVRRLIAIIDSMTPQERMFAAIIKGSRKKRIAAGSGTSVQDVNQLLKQFMQIQKFMKKMKGGSVTKMTRSLKNLLPPGALSGGGFPFH